MNVLINTVRGKKVTQQAPFFLKKKISHYIGLLLYPKAY